MKFCLGKLAPNEEFHPERDGWRKFREPSMPIFWLCALPVGTLPFLVMSVAPVVAFWVTGKVIIWLAFVALANGLGACFDLLAIGMVAAQVPSAAKIRNKGWDTYWKPGNEEADRVASAGDQRQM